jgi:hypothetical protein
MTVTWALLLILPLAAAAPPPKADRVGAAYRAAYARMKDALAVNPGGNVAGIATEVGAAVRARRKELESRPPADPHEPALKAGLAKKRRGAPPKPKATRSWRGSKAPIVDPKSVPREIEFKGPSQDP